MSDIALNPTNPVISIITVVFNSKNLIEKTIQSIINQDYPKKELIIIDGGSKDGTLDIIKRYQNKISYFISEPDRGIYDAMNKGLKAAKGEYVIFINSGDLLESQVLWKIFSEFDPGIDIFYGETNLIDDKGKVLGTRSKLSTRKLPLQMSWQDMKYGMVVSHQSIIVRRSLAPLYDLVYKCSSDIDWVITCLKKSQKIENTKLVISQYLIGGFSIKQKRRCFNERYTVYTKHYGFLNSLWIHAYIILRGFYHKLVKGDNY
jgi:glycosyltransferase involved in cell wall biosynthesis